VTKVRVLAISGSLRRDSHNTRLLRHLAEQAPPGIEIELWEGLRWILLFATPEYNSSVPGVLKNAIDWASRPRASTPMQGKPAAVIGATTGRFGAVRAQAELRKVLASAGARVIDLDLPLAQAHLAFDEAGSLVDPAHGDRGREVLEELAAEFERDREAALAQAA
jgi:chromate reductase, NAD(P)H dehydrogenase (quinone)